MSRFAALVEEEFGFLSDLGFQCQGEGEQSVRYLNANGVFVRVFHDDRVKAVDVRVGLVKHPADALTIEEIMRLEEAPTVRHGFPDIDDMLHYLVSRAAFKLRRHGQRALAGDPVLIEQARTLRQEQMHRYRGPGT